MDPQNNAHAFSFLIDDTDMLECFLNFPDVDPEHPFVLDCSVIADAQNNDAILLQLSQEQPDKCSRQLLDQNLSLICCTSEPNAPFKMCIPDASLDKMMHWYHQTMTHLGANRLAETVGLHFCHPNLLSHCQTVCNTCDPCQRNEVQGHGCGHLPPREAGIAPWHAVAVDSIGPWTTKMPGGHEITFEALTVIDPVANLLEIVRLDNMSSLHASQQFENAWLA